MTLLNFLENKKINSNLIKLFAETLTLGVIRVRQILKEGNVCKAGTTNVHGEVQLKLDVVSNDIFIEVLKNSCLAHSLASEEIEEIVMCDGKAPFTVVFDPLDGSSLVDVNFAVGSIFGVYKAGDLIGQKPENQLASAIITYGPRTTMILCPGRGNGVHEFLLNHDGQFYLTKENLRIEENSKHFAPGNLRAAKERKDYLNLLNYWCENGYTLRYSGGMVPDINHILLKGNGIFSYPPYSEAPNGKLRLLYECGPIAFLAEEAGGMSTDGKARILEKKIESLHQRTPIFIGSKNEVLRCEKFLSL